MSLELQDIEESLRYLAERLELIGAPPTTLFVCGGSALVALRLVSRATHDIDVIALVKTTQAGQTVLEKAAPLPPYLVEATERVARDLGLPTNWLNAGPADLSDIVPVGCLERSEKQEFGSRLRVRFMGRYDQIHVKLTAAVDRGGARPHLQDLKALHPTQAEILKAARWARAHLSSRMRFWHLLNFLFWSTRAMGTLFQTLLPVRARDVAGIEGSVGLMLAMFLASVRCRLYGALHPPSRG